ncbi:HIRAN domain-containing protein [Vibrio chagasii]|nr:HIRAN domain-containing protein [Vibrio chagasii]CAH7249468.1 HIRAN domain-containing protein [Vibrio chagasii]
MKSVFLVWKDIKDGMWHPVAKLTRERGLYRFNYTQGANHPNFLPLPKMEDKSKVYVSIDLFAFFRNRLLPHNRPEFKKVLGWSDMSKETYDELDMLSVTGGARQTDDFRVIAQPQLQDDEYKIRFYISGISHLEHKNVERIGRLKPTEKLQFEFEEDNPFDCNAVLATTIDKEKLKVGYCPKYFNCDIKALMENQDLKGYELNVVKVNTDAPAPYRLLCEFSAKWPKGFMPLISKDYLAHTHHENTILI